MSSWHDDEYETAPAVANPFEDAATTRAALLLQQRRFDDAEKMLRQALSERPDHAEAHRLLAWCLLAQGNADAAEHEARQVVRLQPEDFRGHALLGCVLVKIDKNKPAESAAREALRLEPHDPHPWSVLTSALVGQERWQDALDAAEGGLAVDPDDDTCRNLRAMILTRLGRRDEAAATLHGALENDPDNSHTHANLGWTRLHRREHKAALESFREALRLDPTNQWAKAGLVEALKAKNPLYRLFLGYMLWMSRLSDKVQWAVIIGAWAMFQVVKTVGRANEGWGPLVTVAIVVYVGFVALTWLAVPLFNLSLRFNKYGWHALTEDQRRGSTLLGSILLTIALFALPWTWTGNVTWLLAAAVIAGLLVPSVGIFKTAAGTPRTVMTVAVAGMAALAAVIVSTLFVEAEAYRDVGTLAVPVYLIGVIASFWIVNIVASRYPNNSLA